MRGLQWSMARGVQDGLRVLVHNQIRGEAARQIAGDIGCAKLPIEICGAGCTFEGGSEERHDETISPPWLKCQRPQPKEDLLVCEKACAQAETRAPVHNCAQGDLRPQVHPARASGHALVGQVVPCPHPAPPGESYDEFEADAPVLGADRGLRQP